MHCPNCNAKIKKNDNYCPVCGYKLADENSKETIDPEIVLNDDFDKDDIEKNKVIALFSYISFLFIIPLIVAPNSKYAKFHINQGIILFIADVILEGIGKLLDYFDLGIASGIAEGIAGVGLVVLMIMGIVNAVNGRAKRLPIIGKFNLFK